MSAAEVTRIRTTGAYDALRGGPVGPPLAVRRWPWAVAGALSGAGVAVGLVLVVRAVLGRDAPDAQAPEDVEAVIDLG